MFTRIAKKKKADWYCLVGENVEVVEFSHAIPVTSECHMHKKSQIWGNKDMGKKSYKRLIYNTYKLETTQLPINSKTGKLNYGMFIQ